jgi:hypothetical protein
MPGEFPFPIEEAFLELCREQLEDRVRTYLDYEPESFGGAIELPAIAMLWSGFEQRDEQTGPATANDWTWQVNLYSSLLQGYEEAQRELRSLFPKLLLVVRADPSLGDTGHFARLRDPGERPNFDHGEKIVWKTALLTVGTEETS